jgi:hypothetical protein
MLAIHLIIGLYNTENPTNRLMGLGSVIGLAVIIDPATILILPYALLGLSYFILLDFRKSLIVGYFMVLMLMLGYGLLYTYSDYDFTNFAFGIKLNQWNALIEEPLIQSLVLVNAVIAIILILIRSQYLNQRSVKVRNVHRLISISLPFILGVYLFSRDLHWFDFSLMAIPLTAIIAYYFENAKRVWMYESVFVILLFVQAFGHWYYKV